MSDEETARRALDLGAQGCLVKGRMAFGELRTVVERYVPARTPDGRVGRLKCES